jgi:peptidoglycan/LPS O-acetylase OafA/YrhL
MRRTKANPIESEQARLQVLDAFRALAVCGVVLVHFLPGWLVGPGALNAWGYLTPFPGLFAYGAYGVQLFFMVSGFVIFMTLENCQHLFEFWWRRFARIYPAYITAMVLTAVISLAGPVSFRPTSRDLLVGTTFLTPFVSGTRFIDGVYWTLVVELQFYLFVGLVYLMAPRRFVAAWAIPVAAGTILWLVGGYAEHGMSRVIASRVLIAPHLPLFTVGIAMYFFHRKRAAGGMALFALAVISYCVVVGREPITTHVANAVLVLAFVLFELNMLEWLAVAPVLLLGSISYSLYLTHFKIGVIIIASLKRWLLLPDSAAFLIASSICVTLAYAVYRAVEMPAKTALNTLGRKHMGTLMKVLPSCRFSHSEVASAMRRSA